MGNEQLVTEEDRWLVTEVGMVGWSAGLVGTVLLNGNVEDLQFGQIDAGHQCRCRIWLVGWEPVWQGYGTIIDVEHLLGYKHGLV